MYPVRRVADYSNAHYSNAPMYGYGSAGGGFNSYPQASRGVVGDTWRQPMINDRRDVSCDYAYQEYQHKQGRGEFPVVGRGYEKEYISSGKYGGTSAGYVGSMTGATNDIGTVVELLMDAASGSSTRPSSRIGELDSPVNYYPAMHTTMDASKRYGSFSLAPRRSSMGEPPKYY